MSMSSLGTIALIQIGLFLSGTLSSMIASAWANVVSTDFGLGTTLAAVASLAPTLTTVQRFKMTQHVDNAKSKNLHYALFVTIIGLLIMVAWIMFLQQINPNLIPIALPTKS